MPWGSVGPGRPSCEYRYGSVSCSELARYLREVADGRDTYSTTPDPCRARDPDPPQPVLAESPEPPAPCRARDPGQNGDLASQIRLAPPGWAIRLKATRRWPSGPIASPERSPTAVTVVPTRGCVVAMTDRS